MIALLPNVLLLLLVIVNNDSMCYLRAISNIIAYEVSDMMNRVMNKAAILTLVILSASET